MQEEYISVSDAAKKVGLKRASLYYYIKELHIETHKFHLSKQAYLVPSDVERIREVMAKPWLAGARKDKKKEEPSQSKETHVG